ncbi:MAG: carbohydrate kinase [Lachnospiraceae bacterium]|nr:carbohydrate kinase [Candidatus Colinaster scatohippi]
MNRQYDVVALGELLVDFTENGMSNQGNPLLEANPGGAPCNVLAMLRNLGFKSAFIGKVGDDMFGRMLESRAREAGIDTKGLIFSKEYQTTLAFVHNEPNGDRDFSFYRRLGADVMLEADEIDVGLIKNSKVFHFGTLSMTDEIGEAATKKAVAIAKESGCLISFDPNYRKPLWRSEEYAVEKIKWGLEVCDVLKISDNEIELITGDTDYERGALKLQQEYDIPIVFATLGADGSMAFHNGITAFVPGFITKKTIETTGAGDTFCACALGYMLRMAGVQGAVKKGTGELVGITRNWDRAAVFEGLDEYHLSDLLTYANAAASIITTRKGALSVMPTRDEISRFIVDNLE